MISLLDSKPFALNLKITMRHLYPNRAQALCENKHPKGAILNQGMNATIRGQGSKRKEREEMGCH